MLIGCLWCQSKESTFACFWTRTDQLSSWPTHRFNKENVDSLTRPVIGQKSLGWEEAQSFLSDHFMAYRRFKVGKISKLRFNRKRLIILGFKRSVNSCFVRDPPFKPWLLPLVISSIVCKRRQRYIKTLSAKRCTLFIDNRLVPLVTLLLDGRSPLIECLH